MATITGNNNPNTIIGLLDPDLIDALGGNDVIRAAAGNDTVNAGDGNDSADGQDGNDVLNGGNGADTLLGSGGDDTLNGGSGADSMVGESGNDTFRLTSSEGVGDTFVGGDGNDTIVNMAGSNLYFTNVGDANFSGIESLNGSGKAIDGDNNANTLDFSNVGEVKSVTAINGFDGNDTIVAFGSGAVQIDAGAGNDSVTGNADAETILAGNGNDTVSAGAGDDTITGGSGADSMDGGSGNNTFRLTSSEGVGDTFVGGEGTDTIVNASMTANLYFTNVGDANFSGIESLHGNDKAIDGDNNANTLDFSNVGEVKSVTAINGFDGNDTIVAFGSGAVQIDAGAGDDSVTGNAQAEMILAGNGNDTVSAGAGNDTITGGAGADRMDAGAGDDIFRLTFSEGVGDTFVGGDGNDTIVNVAGSNLYFTNVGDANFSGIESLNGSGKAIDGDNNANTLDFSNVGEVKSVTAINGFDGNDTIVAFGSGAVQIDAGAGNDSVTGNADAETILAGNGNDTVSAGAGNDTITGGAGADRMDAGAGDDIFRLTFSEGVGDTFVGGEGTDTIVNASATANLYFPNVGDANFSGIESLDGNGRAVEGDNGANILNLSGLGTLVNVSTVTAHDGNDQLATALRHENTVGGSTVRTNYIGGAGADSIRLNFTLEQLLDMQLAPANGTGLAAIQAFIRDNVALTVADFQAAALGKGFKVASDFESRTLTLWVDGMQVDASAIFRATGTVGQISAGHAGSNAYTGTSGNDLYFGRAGHDLIQLGDGHDVADGGNDNDALHGGAGNDSLRGDAGNDALNGDAGNDLLIGGAGVDTLNGGDGSDLYEVAGAEAELDALTDNGTTGTDTLKNTGSASLVLNGFVASNGIDAVQGNNQPITGNAGNNTLNFSGVTFSGVMHVSGESGNDLITGTAGADDLRGGNDNDALHGGAGNDSLRGDAGNDALNGDAGDDLLIGGAGVDTLNGGVGNDTYEVMGNEAELDTLADSGMPADGTDTLKNVGTAPLVLNGFVATNGIDAVQGNNQPITGNAGNNTLNFSGVTFSGVMHVSGESGNDLITGTAGAEDLRGGNDNDALHGGAGNDSLRGDAGNDALNGDAGNDLLIGGAGVDTLNGGDGSDLYEVAGAEAELDTLTDNGTTGTDTLKNTGSASLVLNGFVASNGIDAVQGNNQPITGNAGNNTLNFSGVTFSGVMHVSGESGNDLITGTAGAEDLRGGNDNDALHGGAGNDSLRGDAGNDALNGDAGDDLLIGGAGVDTLNGGDGSDLYEVAGAEAELDTLTDNGTTGTDTLKNTGSASLVLNGFVASNGIDAVQGNNQPITGNAGNNTLNFSNVTFSGVMHVSGESGNDLITGTAGAEDLRGGNDNDALHGGAGNDSLRGDAGNDALNGDAGDDLLIGGAGVDTLNGGDGSDLYEVAGAEAELDTLTDNGTTGTDTLKNTGSASLVLNGFVATNGIDAVQGNNQPITGNTGNNTLNFSNVTFNGVTHVSGENGHDVITGTAGADDLRGGNDNDALHGGAGDDSLQGDAGNDALSGGDGADVLIGGAGVDTLDGGAGADRFVFNHLAGADVLNGFDVSLDKLVFDPVALLALGSALSATNVVITTNGAATQAEHRLIFNKSNGQVTYDGDGNGPQAATLIVTLTGGATLWNAVTVDHFTLLNPPTP